MGKCVKAVMRLFEGIENFKFLYCLVIFHIPCCEFKITPCDILINGVDICKFDKLLALLKTFAGMFFPSKKFYLR